MRPCHDRHPTYHPGCVLCHKAATDPRYARLWGEPVPPPVPAPILHESKATGGPGTELKKLFARGGVGEWDGCRCEAIAAEMDAAGPAGVRKEAARFATLIRDNAKRMGTFEKIKAAFKIIVMGYVSIDPIPVLIEKACRLAEKPFT